MRRHLFTSESVTEGPPHLASITPATAAAGASIALRGTGFSVVAGENIVWFGTEAVVAVSYLPLASPTATEIEEIQATVPTTLTAGSYNVMVQTGDQTSNADLNLTVSP